MSSSARSSASGLEAHYAAASERSVNIVEKAIALLESDGKRVTLAGIVAAAGGQISHTTILRNERCRSLYEDARPKRATRVRRTCSSRECSPTERSRAAYLRRMTKDELISLLISAERSVRIERERSARLRDEAITGLFAAKP